MKALFALLSIALVVSCTEKKAPFAGDNPVEKPREEKVTNRYFQETFGDNYVVKVFLDDFDKLSLNDKKLAFHLNEFALATRDLTFIQSHPKGLELRNFVEDLVVGYGSLKGKPEFDQATYDALEVYLKTFYLWHGPYVWTGQNKILLATTEEKARAAVQAAATTGAVTEAQFDEFAKLLLDPAFEPYFQGPAGEFGAQTFYGAGVTPDEAKAFRKAKYPHKYIPTNTFLGKTPDGKIVEEYFRTGGTGVLLPPAMPGQDQFDKYQIEISDLEAVLEKKDIVLTEDERKGYETKKADLERKRDRLYFDWVELILNSYINGKADVFVTADVPEGKYAAELKKGLPHLQAAIDTLPMGYDKASLEFTKRAMESADSNVVYVMAAAIAANKATGSMRLAAGFGDNYADPLGNTAHWTAWTFQAIQSELVKQVTAQPITLGLQASIPWDRQFDNPNPVANTTLIDWTMSTGGLCPACPGGFNTNDDHLGQFAPSLSTIVVNWTTARSQGAPPGAGAEFYLEQADRERMDQKLPEMGKLGIVLHESLGHAIGLRKANYGEAISPHGQWLEEARAEGSAAYFMGDPRVMQIAGITDEDLKVYYLDFVTDAMMITLNRIPVGDTEYGRPHERAFNMISRYLVAGDYGIRVINEKKEAWKAGDKVYFEVTDTKKVREGLGKALAEIMWAIGKGDKAKADELNAKYAGIHDASWLQQARDRAASVGYKPQWVGLLPELKLVEKDGVLQDVQVWHDDTFLKQQLRFSGKALK